MKYWYIWTHAHYLLIKSPVIMKLFTVSLHEYKLFAIGGYKIVRNNPYPPPPGKKYTNTFGDACPAHVHLENRNLLILSGAI